MRKICEILLLILLISCKDVEKKPITNLRAPFTGVEIDTLLSDTMSVRAITLEKDRVWYASDKGTYGYCKFDKSKNYIGQITFDTLNPHFRGIAKNSSSIFMISTEKPAVIYQVSKTDNLVTKVFEDKHPNAFYNGIQFWNDYEGIAMGDPQNGCLSVVITRDAGKTWIKTPCSNLPKIEQGEAGFAASNSSLVVKGDNTWIVTGGTKARIFFSKDKGMTWGAAYNQPDILDPNCDGDFIRYTSTLDGYNKNRLLHTIPFAANRTNVSILMSTDEGATWPIRKTIFSGASAYSSLTVLPDGSLGIYYENGENSTYQMYFVRFSLNWLSGGKDSFVPN